MNVLSMLHNSRQYREGIYSENYRKRRKIITHEYMQRIFQKVFGGAINRTYNRIRSLGLTTLRLWCKIC